MSEVDPTRAALGGLPVATNAWWKANVEATAEVLSLGAMSTMYNDCSVFGEQPGRIFTTQTLWEKYESLLQPQLRYSDAKTALATSCVFCV